MALLNMENILVLLLYFQPEKGTSASHLTATQDQFVTGGQQ